MSTSGSHVVVVSYFSSLNPTEKFLIQSIIPQIVTGLLYSVEDGLPTKNNQIKMLQRSFLLLENEILNL